MPRAVAVISESMARKYWPGEDPVGRRLRIDKDGSWITVVGVCGDIIQDWFDRRNVPTIYRPFAQAPTGYFGIAVRANGDPASIAKAIRDALAGGPFKGQPALSWDEVTERLLAPMNYPDMRV